MTTNRRQVIVGASALAAGMMTLQAHAGEAQPRSLLIVGDWGRAGTQHREVAAQMNVAAGELDCAAVISVGDNFYEDGVSSVDDPKWRSLFEDVYAGSHLRPLPWYVALGNHDYGSVPQAQVDYTHHSDRWHMPERYFKVSGSAIGIPSIDLFVIDTNPLIAENIADDRVLGANARSQDGAAQLVWLDKELAASGAQYKIVVGHQTLFSGGSLHGDTPEMIVSLLPILKRHGVVAYLNGHDHDLQHIARDGLHFICAGAGAEARPVNPIAGTRFCIARPGFAILSVDDSGLRLQFRDFAGATSYQAMLS